MGKTRNQMQWIKLYPKNQVVQTQVVVQRKFL